MTDARFAEIEGHRPYLMRYAFAQLLDGQLTEEAVQEALLAALESLGSFSGKSALRMWLAPSTGALRPWHGAIPRQRSSRAASGRRSRRAPTGCLPWQMRRPARTRSIA